MQDQFEHSGDSSQNSRHCSEGEHLDFREKIRYCTAKISLMIVGHGQNGFIPCNGDELDYFDLIDHTIKQANK